MLNSYFMAGNNNNNKNKIGKSMLQCCQFLPKMTSLIYVTNNDFIVFTH